MVQKTATVSALLLRLSGSDPGPGFWRSGALIHHQQLVRRVASGCGHRAVSSVTSGPSQAAAELCHPGHELCAQPAAHRAAEERRACGPCTCPDRGCCTVSVRDSPALCGFSEQGAGQEGHAAVRGMAGVCRGCPGSGCAPLLCSPVLQEETAKEQNTQEPQSQETEWTNGPSVQCLQGGHVFQQD